MCSINVLITVIRTDNTLKRINGISEPIKKKAQGINYKSYSWFVIMIF
jgi:hypothetical protein